MFRDAYKEVRHHPGRVVATLIAIAISIGFMAAVSVFVTTQSDALGKQAALPASHADVVADVATPKQGVTTAQLVKTVGAVPGVAAVEEAQSAQVSMGTESGSMYVTVYRVPGEAFRWAGLKQGAWPTKANEFVIGQQTADKLKVKVGDTVDTGGAKATITGISNEPQSLFFQSAYGAAAMFPSPPGSSASLVVKATPGTSADQLVTRIHDALAPLVDKPEERINPADGTSAKNLDVVTSATAQADAVTNMVGNFDVMKYVLWAFSGIAALVGMIIIANTFSILLAQRRRQIGLLRAVGASGSQVRRRFLAEAVLLGLIGSLLGIVLGYGVAAIGASYTKAIQWGMGFPLRDLLVEILIGVVLTVIAAMAPSLKATRVAPLEALQPVATSEQVKKASIVRSIVCGLLVLAGLVLAITSLSAPGGSAGNVATGPLARAVVGSLLVALGVLFGAPLYVPLVLRGLGKLFGLFGATPRMAGVNAVRNPRRASATASALMLACGLIVTLQVGTATAQKTVLADIASHYPVDISVQRYDYTGTGTAAATELSPAIVNQLQALPNIAHRAVFSGGAVEPQGISIMKVVALPAEAHSVTDTVPSSLADNQVLVSSSVKKGTPVTVKGNGTTVTLSAVPRRGIDQTVGVVSESVMKKLVAKPTVQLEWLKLSNPDDLGSVMTPLQKIVRANPGVTPSGSVAMSYVLRQVFNVILMVITALLGAAVVIALIGVSNTLGLSVVERTRESALLRALGMQKSSLRLMLLVEALMLALAGVLVGVVLGSFFGWLGVRAAMRQADATAPVHFQVDVPLTLGLVAIAVVAAALASILPGRRAASATPTQALAEG